MNYPQPGTEAKRGDYIRNRTTGRVSRVKAPSQWGRVFTYDGDKWERFNLEVIDPLEGEMHMIARELLRAPDDERGYSLDEEVQRDLFARRLAELVVFGKSTITI